MQFQWCYQWLHYSSWWHPTKQLWTNLRLPHVMNGAFITFLVVLMPLWQAAIIGRPLISIGEKQQTYGVTLIAFRNRDDILMWFLQYHAVAKWPLIQTFTRVLGMLDHLRFLLRLRLLFPPLSSNFALRVAVVFILSSVDLPPRKAVERDTSSSSSSDSWKD